MGAAIDGLVFLLDLYRYILLAVVLLSWINPDPYNPIVRFLHAVTDPILTPFRRMLMPLTMQIRIDFSPILAFLLIGLLQNILRRMQYGGLTPEVVAWALLDGVFMFVLTILFFFGVLLFGRVIIDWTHANRFNGIVRFVEMITDPIVYRFRKFKTINRKYDFSPVFAFFVLVVVYFAVEALRNLVIQ